MASLTCGNCGATIDARVTTLNGVRHLEASCGNCGCYVAKEEPA